MVNSHHGILFGHARNIGHWLDMQLLKFNVCTQMYQTCQKCYPVREHGAGPIVKVGLRRQANCGKRSVVVTYRVVKTVVYRDAWSKR